MRSGSTINNDTTALQRQFLQMLKFHLLYLAARWSRSHYFWTNSVTWCNVEKKSRDEIFADDRSPAVSGPTRTNWNSAGKKKKNWQHVQAPNLPRAKRINAWFQLQRGECSHLVRDKRQVKGGRETGEEEGGGGVLVCWLP